MSTIDHYDLVIFAIRKAMLVGALEVEIERLNGRVNELLEANNRLVEERRQAVAGSFTDRQARERSNTITWLKSRGFEPGMWDRLRQEPLVALDFDKTEDWDMVMGAILDALNQEGVPAWPGDATGCVQQIVMAQARRAKLAETELAKLKAEASTEVPPAEEPHEHWLGLDEYDRVHKTVEGAWSVISMELVSWLAQGLRPIRKAEQSHG